MENIKTIIEEYKVQVENNTSSIYTREDVVKLLTKLGVSLEDVSCDVSVDLQLRITDRMEEVVREINIDDNIELELSGNEIQCSYDIDDLVSELSSMVREEFSLNQE
jgi:hypothetical protein